MTIQANFPAIKPSLMLDFANTKQLDSRITYTRASTATFYNGVTTAMAEQNLLTSSQTFATTWTLTNVSVTDNAIAAPDGTTTAASVIPSASSVGHYQAKTFSSITGVYTYSMFAKANGYNYLQLFWNGGSDYANFFLSGGGSVSASSGATAVITSVGNGWYRCSITSTVSAFIQIYFGAVVTGTEGRAQAFTGDGTSGIYAWGAQLEQRSAVSAYTATTTQAITNYIPALQTAASGVARFDNNPTTGESLGLLIEESRTNLSLQSQFASGWTTSGASISTNTIVAPDGTLTGAKIVEDTATSNHRIYQSVAPSAAVAHCLTVYAKAAERTFLAVEGQSALGGGYIWFNLSTGAVGSSGGSGSPSGTITSVGNGWYRCTLKLTANGTTSSQFSIYSASADGVTNYAGNGFSGIYIWGAQLEAGAFATSYIPTVASQVTRAADAASMTGTNFSTWYRADEGTFYAEALTNSASAGACVFIANDSTGSATNRLHVYTNTFIATTNGTTQALITSSGLVANSFNKITATYKVNDFATSTNAATPATDTSGLVPVNISNFEIGKRGNAVGEFMSGSIKKLAYYPIRVTNAQLQALTS